jgi:hypothetical protein
LRFNNSSSCTDLDYVLYEAQAQMEQYRQYLDEYARQHEEIVRRWEKAQQDQAERDAQDNVAAIRDELKHQEEQREEQVLLDILQHDPVAMAMLKAFVLIHQERSSLTAQIDDANNSLYSMEEHWSRKAVELRRQAEEAQRHAEEERWRLQSDLDDAESKLKKAQRGW